MFNFILCMALMNVLGGRFNTLWPGFPINGRLLFRCLIPGVAAGMFAFELGLGWWAAFVWLAVTAGSALWYAPGWSFDEITGGYDATKYPRWVRRIGLYFFPLDSSATQASTNRKRGIVMKGLRGMFDAVTFALLALLHPLALLLWLGTAAQGFIYWSIAGVVKNDNYDVFVAEFAYGAWRGLLIGTAIALGAY